MKDLRKINEIHNKAFNAYDYICGELDEAVEENFEEMVKGLKKDLEEVLDFIESLKGQTWE